MGDKRILIFVRPPQQISQQILRLNRLIAAKYHNSYMAHANFDWQSHLMLYLSPMPDENLEKILGQVSEVAVESKQFTVELGKIVKTPEGYIYIDCQAPQLFEIRSKLEPRLSPLRGQGVKEKYLQKWDTFSKEEQKRLKDTGLPYIYQPHLTIAQVPIAEVDLALDLINEVNFEGQKFVATEILVSQDDLVDPNWPVVGDFQLTGK